MELFIRKSWLFILFLQGYLVDSAPNTEFQTTLSHPDETARPDFRENMPELRLSQKIDWGKKPGDYAALFEKKVGPHCCPVHRATIRIGPYEPLRTLFTPVVFCANSTLTWTLVPDTVFSSDYFEVDSQTGAFSYVKSPFSENPKPTSSMGSELSLSLIIRNNNVFDNCDLVVTVYFVSPDTDPRDRRISPTLNE